MYEIIAMDNTGKECVIYNDKANNTDYKVENPKLVMAEDTAGSLNFKIPPTHPHYDALDPMKTLLKVIREDECIWAGRITEMRMDLWDQKDITCEGVLGFLNDTVQEPGLLKDTVAYDPKKILQLIINRHNTQIQKADGGVPNKHKTFTVGVVNVYEDPNDTLTPDDEDTNWYTDWNTSWDALNQILFERYPKGHLRCQWRKDDGETEESWHIDYISQENYSTSEQTIEFGKNLIDFTRNYTMTNLKTVCLPRGAVLEDQSEYIEGLNRRLGVTTVNNIANGEPSNYNDQFIRITQAVPDSTALEDMGWIVQEVVWDEVSDKTKLKKRAKKWLREEQFDNMVIEINAVDLHYLNPSIKSADILTKIRCISKPHGMDREFPITKIEIVLDKPESSKITLGSSKQRSFTGSTVGKNRDTDKEISDIWKVIDTSTKSDEKTYPQWSTGSWLEIVRLLNDHHSGNIDLYKDCGWRVGDRRTVTLNSFYTNGDTFEEDGAQLVVGPKTPIDYTALTDLNLTPAEDNSGYSAFNGTNQQRFMAEQYRKRFNLINNGADITYKTVDLMLISYASKDIEYSSQELIGRKFIPSENASSGHIAGRTLYEYRPSSNKRRKKCAFVVAVVPSVTGENGIFSKYSSGATSYSGYYHPPINTTARETALDGDYNSRWLTSWVRDMLGANGDCYNIHDIACKNAFLSRMSGDDYKYFYDWDPVTWDTYYNEWAHMCTFFYNIWIPPLRQPESAYTYSYYFFNPKNFFQPMVNNIVDVTSDKTYYPIIDESIDYVAIPSIAEILPSTSTIKKYANEGTQFDYFLTQSNIIGIQGQTTRKGFAGLTTRSANSGSPQNGQMGISKGGTTYSSQCGVKPQSIGDAQYAYFPILCI